MRAFLFLPAVAVVAACAPAADRYPSLLPRAVEQGEASDAPPAAPPVAAADPALDARVADYRAQLAEAEATFTQAAREAEARVAVARGTGPGAQPWLDAQASLATLDSLRAPALTITVELERARFDRRQAGLPDYPALDAAIDQAIRVSAAQGERIDMLEASLSE